MGARMKPVTNPMLVGAIELLRAEDTPGHRRMVMEEIMHATLLSPVTITPEPLRDENGVPRITPEHHVQLPMFSREGKNFFMAFTDFGELEKWQSDEGHSVFGFRFNDYFKMMNDAGETCQGIVINPFGNNIVLGKDMILNTIRRK